MVSWWIKYTPKMVYFWEPCDTTCRGLRSQCSQVERIQVRHVLGEELKMVRNDVVPSEIRGPIGELVQGGRAARNPALCPRQMKAVERSV